MAYNSNPNPGEDQSEEGEALGKTSQTIPLIKTDALKPAIKMKIPD